MVKARFREVAVKDGDVIELGDNVTALSIHADLAERGMKCIVTWFEEVKE